MDHAHANFFCHSYYGTVRGFRSKIAAVLDLAVLIARYALLDLLQLLIDDHTELLGDKSQYLGRIQRSHNALLMLLPAHRRLLELLLRHRQRRLDLSHLLAHSLNVMVQLPCARICLINAICQLLRINLIVANSLR